MSERIYALFLRLYPRRFRASYGEAALQLFRDRARDETGLFQQFRLWIDLLCELPVSVVREHHRVPPALAQPGPPRFDVVADGAPGIRSLLLAGALSLALFGLISLTIDRPAGNGFPRAWLVRRPDRQPSKSAFSSVFPSNHASRRTAKITGPLLTRPQARSLHPAYAPVAWIRVTGSPTLNASARQQVIQLVIANLRQHYFDPKVAQKIADALRAQEKRGAYNAVVTGEALASLLTNQIRDLSHDMHLEVVYSDEIILEGPPEPTPQAEARYRTMLQQTNCTFEQVQVLPHNIGYLKLNAFPDVSVCKSTASAALASLNHADALIFDLRDNRGGDGAMVSLIAGYLFDHPEFLYDPRTNPTLQSWTQPQPGNKLTDKPVYVLTSNTTISAAEQFTYDLKMLKRVTVVGETTHGSAHAGVFHRLNDHFGIGIPRWKVFNPFSQNDWEGVGVVPDVKVDSAAALDTAEKLAAGKLKTKSTKISHLTR